MAILNLGLAVFCWRFGPSREAFSVGVPQKKKISWREPGGGPPISSTNGMGCFCAVTETARDITQHLINTNASLPAHPIEISMTIPTVPLRARTDEPNSSIQEVYMDDFVNAATQSMDKMYVPKIRRASIHGIHATIFPETATTKHAKNGKEPISESKLKKGDGNFDTTKEVIGFKFCGFKRTVCLPTAKAKRFIKETHTMLRRKRVPSKAAPDSGRKAQACSSHPACNPRLLHHTQQHYEYKQALDYTQHRCKISAPRHSTPAPSSTHSANTPYTSTNSSQTPCLTWLTTMRQPKERVEYGSH